MKNMPIEKKRLDDAESAFLQLQALCDNTEFQLATSQADRATIQRLCRRARTHLKGLENFNRFAGPSQDVE